jgi:hypothetical protein
MAAQRTWVWVVAGICGVGLLMLIGLAGAGVYFVTRHISTEPSTSAEAIRAFEAVRAAFPDQKPLYELDNRERPTMTRPIRELPTSPKKPEQLRVLAWDPHDERLVRISLPFWILRMHKAKMGPLVDVGERRDRGDSSFDLEHLELDGQQLERIGPALVLDYRGGDGVRVLLWTQ